MKNKEKFINNLKKEIEEEIVNSFLEYFVDDYKNTKNDFSFKRIYNILKPYVNKKARFLYEHKWYSANQFKKCKFCLHCKRIDGKSKEMKKIICEECLICECDKRTFNLKKYGLCDLKEVIQDLWIVISDTVVKNYDCSKKNFKQFVENSLYAYEPSFINADFINLLKNKSTTYIEDEKEQEMDVVDPCSEKNQDNQESMIEQIRTVCKSKREIELIELYLNNEVMTQEKAGEVLHISQPAIFKIFKKLQKRLEKIKNKSYKNH